MEMSSTNGLRDALVGAWLLVSYESQAVDGSDLIHPFGSDPEGLIVYSADGFMAAQLMSARRRPYSQPDLHSAPISELADAAAGYVSYSGPFSVDGNVVAHHVRTSLMPNWIGQTQYRKVSLESSVLTLSPTEPALISGKLRTSTLAWRRASGTPAEGH
jgi:hypothetical protein